MSNQPDTKTGGSGSGSAAGAAPAATAKKDSPSELMLKARLELGKGWSLLTGFRSPMRFLKIPELTGPGADEKNEYIEQRAEKATRVDIQVSTVVQGRNLSLNAKPSTPGLNLSPFDLAAALTFHHTTTTTKTHEAAVVWLAFARFNESISKKKLPTEEVAAHYKAKDLIRLVGTHVITYVVLGAAASVVERVHVADTSGTFTLSVGAGAAVSTVVGFTRVTTEKTLSASTAGGDLITKTGDLKSWSQTVTVADANTWVAGVEPIHKVLADDTEPQRRLRDEVQALYDGIVAVWSANRQRAVSLVSRYNVLLQKFKVGKHTQVVFFDFSAPIDGAAATASATATATATAAAVAADVAEFVVPVTYVRFVIGLNVAGPSGYRDELWQLSADADTDEPLLAPKLDARDTHSRPAFLAHIQKIVNSPHARLSPCKL